MLFLISLPSANFIRISEIRTAAFVFLPFPVTHNMGEGNDCPQLEEYFAKQSFFMLSTGSKNIIDGCWMLGLHALSWIGTIYFHGMWLNFRLVI